MRLYNKYDALTDEGNKLFSNALDFCVKFAKDCEARGVDLRDAHGILMNAAGVGFCDTILRKAFLMKKAEREEKKHHPSIPMPCCEKAETRTPDCFTPAA